MTARKAQQKTTQKKSGVEATVQRDPKSIKASKSTAASTLTQHPSKFQKKSARSASKISKRFLNEGVTRFDEALERLAKR